MVLAGLHFSELIVILKENGWEIETDEFWEQHNRIILKKGSDPVIILQFKPYYKFAFVVEFLAPLGIKPPEHCQKPYDQWNDYLRGEAPDPTDIDPET